MIVDCDVRRQGAEILLGISLQDAVLDVIMNEHQLRQCVELLQEPQGGLSYCSIGKFGVYPVTLNVGSENIAIIMIDGPYFEASRNQSAGIWVDKGELLRLLRDVGATKADGSL